MIQDNTQHNKNLGITRLEATRIRKNKVSRYTGKHHYRVYADAQDLDDRLGLVYHNPGSFYVMDGDIEQGWEIVKSGTLESVVKCRNFDEARTRFERLTHGTAPIPEWLE